MPKLHAPLILSQSPFIKIRPIEPPRDCAISHSLPATKRSYNTHIFNRSIRVEHRRLPYAKAGWHAVAQNREGGSTLNVNVLSAIRNPHSAWVPLPSNQTSLVTP